MEDERVVAACPLCAMTVTVSTLECPNCGTDLEPAPGMGPAAPEEVAPAGGEVRELDHVRHGELSARVVAGVRALVEICGGDPRGEGMRETPERVLRAYMEMTRGYDEDPRDVLSAVFSQGGDSPVYDEMIILRGIRFSSVCEHHLLPFSGVATVAYVPGETGVVVGLSKMARLVDLYARRFQIQERMTVQIADAMRVCLGTETVACVVRATHQCMTCRGVMKHGAEMVTSSMFGRFRESGAARAELLALD